MAKPTRAGFIDPNFPNPNGPHDAMIVIYGYVPQFVVMGTAIAAAD